jgi:hypothetical protein
MNDEEKKDRFFETVFKVRPYLPIVDGEFGDRYPLDK